MRILAHLISVVFHPLLMLTYMIILLLLINPYLFGVNHIANSSILVLRIFIMTFLLPGFAVLMMKQLGLIESLQMQDKQERIGPLIITGMFYIWVFYNFYKSPVLPQAYTIFMLGATIGLFIAFLINIFEKVSLHGVGIGGLLGMVIITMLLYSYPNFSVLGMTISMNTLLIITILLCGIVGTARLILNAHDPSQVYKGFIIGVSTQFIALRILG